MNTFEKAGNFIYRNARPLDLARWKFHFENGSADEVLNILSAYQNEDGGFAYALEPDCWNINSTPIATWAATKLLSEINFADTAHPIINGILKYLESGKDFENGKWYNTVKSNNDYPHAIWWESSEGNGLPCDNPTVSLTGFILKFADKDSSLYHMASDIAVKAFNEFMENPTDETHTLRCFSDLYCCCNEIDDFNLFDLKLFKENLAEKVNEIICKDVDKWYTDYVCKPSFFFSRRSEIFNTISRELAEKEADMILKTQLSDGSYPVVWQWHTDYKEFEISANWWKSSIIIDNMLYLRYFGRI